MRFPEKLVYWYAQKTCPRKLFELGLTLQQIISANKRRRLKKN